MRLIFVFVILAILILAIVRLNWPFWFFLLRSCNHPQVLNLRDDAEGRLYFPSVPKSTIIQGTTDTGKTVYAVQQSGQFALEQPECTIISLEISGAFKKNMLKYSLAAPNGERLQAKFVVDALGHPEYVKAMPEWSPQYGVPFEDQVHRVSTNFKQLHPQAVELNPTISEAFNTPARELCRLLVAMRNEAGHCFPITMGNELLTNHQKLQQALNQFGAYAPSAKEFFEHELLDHELSAHDRHLRTLALRNALGDIETREARATLGYPVPSYTFKEAIARHQLVMVTGEYLLNQREVLGYLLVQRFSLLMEQINKRVPDDPANTPVIIIIDELPWLLKATGLSEEIGDLQNYYRSRNVGLIVIIQNHSQLSESLLEKIWNFGNIVSFANENFEEATATARNLLTYNPLFPKYPLPVADQPPETYQGQAATVANFIMNLKARECLVKRYRDQQTKDRYTLHVRRTKDMPTSASEEAYRQLNDQLIAAGSIRVTDALQTSHQFKIPTAKTEDSPKPGDSPRRGA